MNTIKENSQEKHCKNGPETTCDFADIIEAEKIHLDLVGKKEIRGLAFSGGGIRSASFGLGVMQALVANRQLEKMDYMSTVSGGGYLGSALTWALKQGGKNAGTSPKKFPLGQKNMSAREDETNGKNDPGLQNNGLLDYIRQHSSYLIPTGSLGIVSFVGVVLRSILISLFVYFSLLLLVMTVIRFGGLYSETAMSRMINTVFPFLNTSGVFIPSAILLILLFLGMSLMYSLRTFITVESGVLNEYLIFIKGQVFIGYLWKTTITCLILGSIPYVGNLLDTEIDTVAVDSTLYGIIVGIWQYAKAQKNEISKGPISKIIIYLAVFALIYGLLLLAYAHSDVFVQHLSWFLLLLITTFSFGVFVNLNSVGPHRIWRDRLMEAFMPDVEAVKENGWKPAKKADSALMENMCDVDNPKPYHIINTNIILNNSKQVKFRGRGGDNFIFSPLYCGSEATGWRTTKTFQKKDGRGITLASAMATSAAALNPDAGVSGGGVTRNTIVSILLSVLNLRLGYWSSNPYKNVWPVPPNFIVPGLKTEIMRKGFTEKDTRILLSDGGHFENLALYELIRRKLDVIVVSDGGADPGFNFDDLANVVEKVRVDFGVKIAFRKDEKYDLNGILPGTKGSGEFDKKYLIAQRGYAIADVFYNDKDDSKGILVYLKLAMVPGLPTDVYSYKGVHPSFPHESTSDQFFDEKQFEAYRELGYSVTWGMMESEEGKRLFVSNAH